MKPQGLIVICFISICYGQDLTPVSAPSESFPYHATLDDSYQLYWSFNTSHITFEVHVDTNGYVAFGISPNGKMYPSDVIVGGVKDGTPYFQDYHTTGHTPPVLDVSQDWTLLSASEHANVTVLKFTRKLETCDKDDLPIFDGTTRVIYSYHPDDLSDTGMMPYHGSDRRGAKSLLLLDPPYSDLDPVQGAGDVKTFDFINKNYSVPADGTTYHCSSYLLPDYAQKQHMIKYEPIIQPGNEKYVHHLVIYSCMENFGGPIPDDMDGQQFLCYYEQPAALQSCYAVMLAWATGGKEFVYPDNVGFPLGKGEPRFFMMEIHYNNPDGRSDIVDNSGIRIHLTPNLRQHDAGILLLGVEVNTKQIIPPHQPNFVSSGYCSGACLGGAMEAAGVTELHVFANLLHSHLLGKSMRTRVVRGDDELPPLAQDNNYDFDYQEMRVLRDEYTLKKGDSVIVECVYDSAQKSGITFGGTSTHEEMCESFPLYYPRIPLLFCESTIAWNNLPLKGNMTADDYAKTLDFTNPEVLANFTQMAYESDVNLSCVTPDSYNNVPRKQKDLQPMNPYVKPDPCSP